MKARAAALFDALDADGSGEIDDEEFIEGLTPGPVQNVQQIMKCSPGCMKDDVFISLLEAFDGEKIWGEIGL